MAVAPVCLLFFFFFFPPFLLAGSTAWTSSGIPDGRRDGSWLHGKLRSRWLAFFFFPLLAAATPRMLVPWQRSLSDHQNSRWITEPLHLVFFFFFFSPSRALPQRPLSTGQLFFFPPLLPLDSSGGERDGVLLFFFSVSLL